MCDIIHTLTQPHTPSQTISQSIDFLETIDKDIPKGELLSPPPPTRTHTVTHHTVTGCWSVVNVNGGAAMVLRSLQWPGMVAFTVPNSRSFGYFYCGIGEKNPDLLFML